MTAQQQFQLNLTFTNAYQEYGKLLNMFALKKINNQEISKDLVQQTFMNTWLYLRRGGEILKMKAFLCRVLNNLIIDEYRKHKVYSLEALLEKGFEPAGADPKSLLGSLDEKAALDLIGSFPDAVKSVMLMRYMQDLSIPEIALITGKSNNSVSVQLHRGAKKLKELYSTKYQ